MAENDDNAPSKLQQLEALLGAEVLRRVVEPERRGAMADADGRGEFATPCGDAMDLYVKLRDGVVIRASFVSRGCAHTHACAAAASCRGTTSRIPSSSPSLSRASMTIM